MGVNCRVTCRVNSARMGRFTRIASRFTASLFTSSRFTRVAKVTSLEASGIKCRVQQNPAFKKIRIFLS